MRSFQLLAVALTAWHTAACGSPQSAVSAPQPWGPTTRGLRLGISLAIPGSGPSDGALFNLLFQNVSDREFYLQLGYMLWNGKRYPLAVRLIHTTPTGKTCELWAESPPVAGRVDPVVVGLREGGTTHTLALNLGQYWCPAFKEYRLELADGRHRIKARFDGGGVANPNLDTPEIALLNYWKGSVESNVLEFNVTGGQTVTAS